jgi:F-box protein 21
VVNEPLLWKQYCQQEFRFWDERHAYQHKLQNTGFEDWKGLFASRHASSVATHKALDDIVETELGRLDSIESVLNAGYDAKEDLLDLFEHASSSPNHLALRYWSHAALGCLQRMVAVQKWLATKDSAVDDDPKAYVVPLVALDMFILEERSDGDIDDVSSKSPLTLHC